MIRDIRSLMMICPRMKHRGSARSIGIWFVILFGLLTGQDAAACACCSHDGQRHVRSETISDYTAGVLAQINFAEDASLSLGDADIDDIKGIKVTSGSFALHLRRIDAEWSFAFTDRAGGEGMLTFSLPNTIARFEIDPRAPERDRLSEYDRMISGPVIYKEWQLEAPVRTTGMFAVADAGAPRITLVLHGRGNSCSEAKQFTAWTMILHSAGTSNIIFGRLDLQ